MLSFLQPRPYYSNIERLEGNLYLNEASTWAKLLPHAHAPRPPRATLELLSTDSPTPPRACFLRNFSGPLRRRGLGDAASCTPSTVALESLNKGALGLAIRKSYAQRHGAAFVDTTVSSTRESR